MTRSLKPEVHNEVLTTKRLQAKNEHDYHLFVIRLEQVLGRRFLYPKRE